MNRGYAFGFLIVLLVLVLGMYVAYTGFVSSREALQAEPTAPQATEVGQSARPTVELATAVRPTATLIVTTGLETTPTVALGGTPTIAVLTLTPTEPAASPVPASTESPAPVVTDLPRPSPTIASATQAPPPTPVPAPAYQFRLAGPPAPDPERSSCCYLYGTVRDAAGNGLEGIRVQAQNEWNTLPPAVTKGGGELGQYDITIGRDMVAWDVVVLDAAGNQISTKVQVQFNPGQGNAVRIDWQRTY